MFNCCLCYLCSLNGQKLPITYSFFCFAANSVVFFEMIIPLSKQDTTIIKGMAICAMMLHHLYYSIPEWAEPYEGVLLWLGELGKVCVSMFLFCSGYGLSVQYEKVKGLKCTMKFVVKRFFSFYVNYWVVFAVFVPITVFVFHRPLTAAYGENANICGGLALDILGLLGFSSYNITWWFNKMIIILWLLFPFIYCIAKKYPLLALLGSLIVARCWNSVAGHPGFGNIHILQMAFVLGILWQTTNLKSNRIVTSMKEHPILFSFMSICLVALFVYLRMRPVIPHWSGLRMDAFLTCTICLFVVSSIKDDSRLSTGLSFLGKHSGNIYLIHTFFNSYWHFSWLHSSQFMRSGVNFFVLLALSLLTSVLL